MTNLTKITITHQIWIFYGETIWHQIWIFYRVTIWHQIWIFYGVTIWRSIEKIQNRNAYVDNEIPPGVWKTRKFNDILVWLCNVVYKQRTIEEWTNGCILNLSRVTNTYRVKTAIAAKAFHALFLNRIRPKIEKILRENQNDFRINRSTSLQILIIREIIEGVRAKTIDATLLFIDFSKALKSIHKRKMEEILPAYDLPKETFTTIIMLYNNTKAMVCSPEGNTDFFDIVIESCTEIYMQHICFPPSILRTSNINTSNKRN